MRKYIGLDFEKIITAKEYLENDSKYVGRGFIDTAWGTKLIVSMNRDYDAQTCLYPNEPGYYTNNLSCLHSGVEVYIKSEKSLPYHLLYDIKEDNYIIFSDDDIDSFDWEEKCSRKGSTLGIMRPRYEYRLSFSSWEVAKTLYSKEDFNLPIKG